jgi:hypothetical protein
MFVVSGGRVDGAVAGATALRPGRAPAPVALRAMFRRIAARAGHEGVELAYVAGRLGTGIATAAVLGAEPVPADDAAAAQLSERYGLLNEALWWLILEDRGRG